MKNYFETVDYLYAFLAKELAKKCTWKVLICNLPLVLNTISVLVLLTAENALCDECVIVTPVTFHVAHTFVKKVALRKKILRDMNVLRGEAE